MKGISSLQTKLKGLSQAVDRYPLTMLFLFITTVVSAKAINDDAGDYSKFIFTFIIGAFISAVGQHVYERFFTKRSERLLIMGGAVVLTALYFLSVRTTSLFSIEPGTKTAVALFALLIAFIWVPTIKSKIPFNGSFLSAFKAFFTTVLFSTVISAGVSLIIFAIDQLFFSVNYKATIHALNIIYSLFAPIFFLSLTPPYPGKNDANRTHEELALREQMIERSMNCPKTLEILLSYIIIPLTAVYTMILLVYVILNISGDFWTKNLLEPLLVSYAIIVILVYILASSLENRFVHFFRKIFPKILIPIVLFQTLASMLKINEMGVTHGRYYVIMFGIFAIISGIIFSFMKTKKNGLIAPILIIFSAISIIPPIDAFTVSRVNQFHLLEHTLEKNNMLENNRIVPNSTISTEDKLIITKTTSYLDSLNYKDTSDWLPDKLFYYDHFNKTFGFDAVYDNYNRGSNYFANLDWSRNPAINIDGYERMVHLYINSYGGIDAKKNIPLEINGNVYTLTKQPVDNDVRIRLMSNDKELIQFNTKDIVNLIQEMGEENNHSKGHSLTAEEATLIQENEQVKMSILINSAEIYESQYNFDLYIFIKIK
ncbi:DUF4153 domain-containing protein [Bacillus sp. FJAT-50079]|uniref:DUF4153 domain-containing protein n=1 Tax=Bacillus sp. FJAT-50079 TaxID=2833577 RepID=UPI0032D585E3